MDKKIISEAKRFKNVLEKRGMILTEIVVKNTTKKSLRGALILGTVRVTEKIK